MVADDGSAVIFSARPSGSAQGLGDPSSLYTVPLDGRDAPHPLVVRAFVDGERRVNEALG